MGPHHFVGLPIPLALSGVFYFCCVRLTKCCSRVIFSFFGDLLSTPHFPFLCCRPDSNTIVPTQPVPLLDKGILSKRKGIYILKGYFSFPPRRQGNAEYVFSLKKKKNININSNFKLIKYKFFHCLLTQGIVFCTTIQNSLFLFKTSKYIYTLGSFISLI